jgi:RNA polymerase sigma factor (sigma-70 family)
MDDPGTNTAMQTVFVVDDDESVRQSLRWLLESVRLRVETFDSSESFLQQFDASRAGCLVLDVRMPGLSGPELLDRLVERHLAIPVVFLSGHGDVQMAVRAMKAGAMDFIEKPYNRQQLLQTVQKALHRECVERERREQEAAFRSCLGSLTPRERQILELITTGRSNRVIGTMLGISCRTVEAHRAKLMRKMRAGSLADLLQRAASFHLLPPSQQDVAVQHQHPQFS